MTGLRGGNPQKAGYVCQTQRLAVAGEEALGSVSRDARVRKKL